MASPQFSSRHRTQAGVTSHQNTNLLPDATMVDVPLVQPEDTSGEEMPLWKRPAAWWLVVLAPFNAIILSLTLYTRFELYMDLTCRVHGPGFQLPGIDPQSMSQNTHQNPPLSFNFNNFAFAGTLPASNPCSSFIEAVNLANVMTFVTGILTFMTVAWWGSFSDRHGRSRTMGIIAFGQLLSLLIIIFVANYVELIPGGYWVLLVEAMFTGAVGGSASEHAIVWAYLSDITTREKRSTIFSIVLGSILAGMRVGPILGSFVLRTTHNPLSVFYVGAALKFIHVSLVWFALPESLTTVKMHGASVRHQENQLRWFQRLYFFLKPLSTLFPEKISNPNSSIRRRDWNLTVLVLGYGAMILAVSSSNYQIIYTFFNFGIEYLRYCRDSIGFASAIFLTLILPATIKFAKHRRANISNPHTNSEREPLLADGDRSDQPAPPTPAVLDLALARFSVLVEIVVYTLLPFAPTGNLFVLFFTLGSFGAGLVPAINSIVLELYTRKIGNNAVVESGKLFGALSVARLLFGGLGLTVYWLIFAATLNTYPRTIFFVALGNAVAAFLILSFVRVVPEVQVDDGEDIA